VLQSSNKSRIKVRWSGKTIRASNNKTLFTKKSGCIKTTLLFMLQSNLQSAYFATNN